MTRFLMQMQPTKLDNIIAMVALFRPGPDGFHPCLYPAHARRRKRLPTAIRCWNRSWARPTALPFTRNRSCRRPCQLARLHRRGMPMGCARSSPRRTQPSWQATMSSSWKGAVKNGIPRRHRRTDLHDWEGFAHYGFNKSHAADYGVIAVQTAYLKAHYPLNT